MGEPAATTHNLSSVELRAGGFGVQGLSAHDPLLPKALNPEPPYREVLNRYTILVSPFP